MFHGDGILIALLGSAIVVWFVLKADDFDKWTGA